MVPRYSEVRLPVFKFQDYFWLVCAELDTMGISGAYIYIDIYDIDIVVPGISNNIYVVTLALLIALSNDHNLASTDLFFMGS